MPTDTRSTRSSPAAVRCCQGLACALATLAAPQAQPADYQFIPYASAQAEYNSNVFDLSGHQQALVENGDRTLADIVQRYLAGAEGSLSWGQQKLGATLEGRRFDFSHFQRLDHNEYRASGNLDWQLGSVLGGVFEYRQERRMASFADRSSTDLSIENERIATSKTHIEINPRWQLEGELRARKLDSPLPGFADFRLLENVASGAVRYRTEQGLSFGVLGEYLNGRFENISDASHFHQNRAALFADYAVPELSKLSADLGYTQRRNRSGSGGDESALTGSLAYHRELSGKTAADVRVFRRVASYIGNADSVTETGAGGALAWQATQKTSLNLRYQWTRGEYPQSGITSAPQRRVDDTQLASVQLAYQALPWLLLRPYGGYQLRNSNVDLAGFHAAVGGIELRIRFE